MNWFDLPEDAHLSAEPEASRMRLYIIAGLLGVGVLGGVLHLLPA